MSLTGSRLLSIDRMAAMGAIIRPGPRSRPYHALWIVEIPDGRNMALAFPPGLAWDAVDRLLARWLASGFR